MLSDNQVTFKSGGIPRAWSICESTPPQYESLMGVTYALLETRFSKFGPNRV